MIETLIKLEEAEAERDRWEVEIQLAVAKRQPTSELWQRMCWADHRVRMWEQAVRRGE